MRAFTWEQRKLGNVFKYEQPQPYIVESTEYDDCYDIPVLTAGQSFVLGFTNETTGIKNASQDYPVIIFDDFTTLSHFVDFSFKIKSSAIKLLTLANSSDDIYCGYNILKNIGYIPVNHERHWISIFSNFDVLIPGKTEEQKRIGKFLKNLDNLITLHQRKFESLKKMKKALLEKMFPRDGENMPSIRFKGFTDSWEQRKLGEMLIDIADGPFGSNLKTEHYTENQEARIIQLSNLSDNGWQEENKRYTTFKHAKEIKRCIVNKDELVMGKMMPAGMTIIRPDAEKMYVLSSDCVRIKLNQKGILNNFFLYTTKSVFFLDQVNSDSQGSTRIRTSISKIRNMDFRVPSLPEEQKIGAYFVSLDNLITLHQRKLEKFKNIKKAMLEKMFV